MQNRRSTNRTHYIHRLNYSAQERLAGAFVLIAATILVWLLVSSEKTRNLFAEEYILYGTLNTIQAVNEDTTVSVSGLDVGHVVNVDITDENTVIVTMSLLKKYQKLIRADSRATLTSYRFALINKSAIEISIGSPSLPVLRDKNLIQIIPDVDLSNVLQKVEPVLISLQDSIERINAILSVIEPERIRHGLEAMEQTLQHSQQLLTRIDPQKITDSVDNLQRITRDSRRILEAIEQQKGLAGDIIYDHRLSQNVRASTNNLLQVTEQMKTLLQAIQEQVDDIPELKRRLLPLLDEADKTIKATQSIWPLSGAIESRPPQPLAPAASPE